MRALALALLAALGMTLSALADSGSIGGAPTGGGTTLPAAASTGETASPPCGCGGPKSYYFKKYGTIKAPAFQSGTQNSAPVNPPIAGTSG
ncbi:MAG: hypothetical protein ACOY3L_02160 [Pseudomonadota bacterium]